MMAAAVLVAALTLGMPAQPPAIHTPKVENTGAQASAYQGRYYSERLERFRLCVGQREGRFQYWGTGSNGRYQGTYQMTPELIRGAAWMMTRELRATYPSAWRAIRDALLETPGHKWSRFYQDMAFFTIASWRSPGSGAKHWSGGRYSCHI